MNLAHLQFVHTVGALRSFSRAADVCHVTQSSLSNAVSQIESKLGSRIFSRTTRKVNVTPFGEIVLPLIADVLQSTDLLSRQSREYLNPSYQLLRVGLSPVIDTRVLGAAIEPFRRKHPKIEIVFKECLQGDMHARLASGSIDLSFGISARMDKAFGGRTFYSEPLVYLPNRDSPDEPHGGKEVSVRDLRSDTFALTQGCGLADVTRQLFRRHRLSLREYPGQALSYKVLEDWSDLGVASAILPLSKLSRSHPRARFLRGIHGPARITYQVNWQHERSKQQPVALFLSYFQETIQQLLPGLIRQKRPMLNTHIAIT